MKTYLTRPVILGAVGYAIVAVILFVVSIPLALIGIGIADAAIAEGNHAIGNIYFALLLLVFALYPIAALVFGWLAARGNALIRFKANLPLTAGFCALSGAVAIGLVHIAITICTSALPALALVGATAGSVAGSDSSLLLTGLTSFGIGIGSSLITGILIAALGALGGALYYRFRGRKLSPATVSAEPT